MIRIAVCDDDIIFLEQIRDLISSICLKQNISNVVDLYADGYGIMEDQDKYHVIFLDIEMPMIDGLTVAENINAQKKNNDIPFIVFVSSQEHYVFNALANYPFSFIRKKTLERDLQECILKIKAKMDSNCCTYIVHSGRNDVIIKIKDTIYLEKMKNYVIYHITDGEYTVRSDINNEYEKLAHFGFIRPHIGFLVNNEFIKSFSTNKILLVTGESIPMSKRFKDAKNEYFRWLGGKYA
jgi:DNA-binding LytR/AlgR family response regulator